MSTNPVFVGIDVAKASLEVAVHQPAARWAVEYTDSAVVTLGARLTALAPTLIVLEATGGLEAPLVGTLAAASLPVVVVNPRQVRDVAKATGRLAKTDTLEAAVLAHFADPVRPPLRPLPDAATQGLAARVTRRRQLGGMLTAERNRLGAAPPVLHKELQAHIRWLERRIAGLDTEDRKHWKLPGIFGEAGPLNRSSEQRVRHALEEVVCSANSGGTTTLSCGSTACWSTGTGPRGARVRPLAYSPCLALE